MINLDADITVFVNQNKLQVVSEQGHLLVLAENWQIIKSLMQKSSFKQLKTYLPLSEIATPISLLVNNEEVIQIHKGKLKPISLFSTIKLGWIYLLSRL